MKVTKKEVLTMLEDLKEKEIIKDLELSDENIIYVSMFNNVTVLEIKRAFDLELHNVDNVLILEKLLYSKVRKFDMKVVYYKFQNPNATNQDLIKHFKCDKSYISAARGRLKKLGYRI